MRHAKRKPCPFCGCEESMVMQLHGSPRWRVNCLGCDALGPQAQSERGAARRWNAWAPDKTFEERRAEPEPLRFTEG
jgi:Lar family restriction alleviation protein